MSLLRRAVLLSFILALPARAAERAVDAIAVVPAAGPQSPSSPRLGPAGLNAGAAVPSVPPAGVLAAPLSAGAPQVSPTATAPQGSVFASGIPTAAAPAAARFSAAPRPQAVFGKKQAPALPASALAAAQPSAQPAAQAEHAAASSLTGSGDHPLILRAKEEARKLGTSAETDAPPDAAASAELARMRDRGWAMLPAGSLVTPELAARVKRDVDRDWLRDKDSLFNTWYLLPEFAKEWKRDVGADENGRGGVREMVEELTRRLQRTLPDEPLALKDAQLRLRYQKVDQPGLHVDGAYVTATVALKGPGTLIYDRDSTGYMKEYEAPLDAVALISNDDRERATGMPGTVHSSPTADKYRPARDNDERWVLIVRWVRPGLAMATAEESQRLKQLHAPRLKSAFALRKARDPKPAKKGFWSSLLSGDGQ